jgi:hypothetical protein
MPAVPAPDGRPGRPTWQAAALVLAAVAVWASVGLWIAIIINEVAR